MFRLLLVCLLFCPMLAVAETPKRVALVVGIADYGRDREIREADGFIVPAALDNAARDANLVGDALTEAGFDVERVVNPSKRRLVAAINRFARRLQQAGEDAVGVFYFAGHGAQGRPPHQRDIDNFMIPIDADLQTEIDLSAEAVGLSRVSTTLSAVAQGAVILILDACRDFAIPQANRSGFRSRGLAVARAKPNTLVAYSTAPGAVAWDGPPNGNGPYASAFARALRDANGVRAEDIFFEVRRDVLTATEGEQQPWENSSLLAPVRFGVEQTVVASLDPNAEIAPAETPAASSTTSAAPEADAPAPSADSAPAPTQAAPAAPANTTPLAVPSGDTPATADATPADDVASVAVDQPSPSPTAPPPVQAAASSGVAPTLPRETALPAASVSPLASDNTAPEIAPEPVEVAALSAPDAATGDANEQTAPKADKTEARALTSDPVVLERALTLGRTDWQQVQRRLAELGHNPRGVDGVPGANTRRALRRWQRTLDAPDTGYLDDAQLAQLLGEQDGAAASDVAALDTEAVEEILGEHDAQAVLPLVPSMASGAAPEAQASAANTAATRTPLIDLSRGDWRQVQRALKTLGYDPRGVDGIPGANTSRALRAWQRANELPASGNLDAQQFAHLLATAETLQPRRTRSTSTATVAPPRAPTLAWQRRYGGRHADGAYDIVATADGGALLVGVSAAQRATDNDMWLVKTDAGGNKLWERHLGGPQWDSGHAVVADPRGGYIVVGATESFGAGRQDGWVVSVDARGSMRWQRPLGNAGHDHAEAVAATGDGGFVIAGTSQADKSATPTAWLIKLDQRGQIVWNRVFAPGTSAKAVRADDDGGFVVAGIRRQAGASAGIEDQPWLAKVDAAGRPAWQRSFADIVAKHRVWPQAVELAADGGYLMAGVAEHIDGRNTDLFLLKTDANGERHWKRRLGGRDKDKATALRADGAGGYLIAGASTGASGRKSMWLVRIDERGRTDWQERFGGTAAHDWAEALALGENGALLLAGFSANLGADPSNAFLVKVETGGGSAAGAAVAAR